jgi:hypothetical protein
MRQDHLEDQCVGGDSEAVTDAEFDAHRIALIVDYREERLLLPAERLEVPQGAVIGIVFNRGCPTWEKL